MSRVSSRAARLILTATAMLAALAAGVASAGTDVGSVTFTLGGKRLSSEWFPSEPRVGTPGDTLQTTSVQPALGIEMAWGRAGWPVQLALNVQHSYDDGVQRFPYVLLQTSPLKQIPMADVRRRASTLEIGLGARRAWNVLGLNPYLGAGGAWVRANIISELIDPGQGAYGAVVTSVRGRHSTLGVWVGGGLYRRIGPRFHIGATGRFSRARIEFPERGRVFGQDGGYQFASAPADPKLDAGGRHIGLILGWSFPSRK